MLTPGEAGPLAPHVSSLALRMQIVYPSPTCIVAVRCPARAWHTFHVEDDEAQTLGRDATTGHPALCLKTMDGWTSVYSAAPCIASTVLRALGKKAGVHFYVDKDGAVYANRSLLSVTAVEPGIRKIHLPDRATVVDGFTGEALARRTVRFDAEFTERESRLFVLH